MPEERRSVTKGPPTYLMQSYNTLTEQKKKQLSRLGLGLLVFSFVVPMLASIALRAFTERGLPMVFWLFAGVGMVVGVCLFWPQLGIYLIGSLPNAIGKILPKNLATMITKNERRESKEE